jgi:hypothetical protein
MIKSVGMRYKKRFKMYLNMKVPIIYLAEISECKRLWMDKHYALFYETSFGILLIAAGGFSRAALTLTKTT